MAAGEIKYQISIISESAAKLGETEGFVSGSVLSPLSGANEALSVSRSGFSGAIQKSISALHEEDGTAPASFE